MPSRHTIISREPDDQAERIPEALTGGKIVSPASPDEPEVPVGLPKKKPDQIILHSPQGKEDLLKTKDLERQRIENELQRQRMMAILGKTHKTQTSPPAHHQLTPVSAQTKTIIRRASRPDDSRRPAVQKETDQPTERETRVVIKTKKHIPVPEEIPEDNQEPEPITAPEIPLEIHLPQSEIGDTSQNEPQIGIKRIVQRSKDDIFEGKGISSKTSLRVNDDALLHTRLKSKKMQINDEKLPDRNDPPEPKNGHGVAQRVRKSEKTTVDDEESGSDF